MKTAEQLREELCEIFDNLKSGELSPRTAREMIKSTSTQISIVRTQLEVASMCNIKPDIKRLGL